MGLDLSRLTPGKRWIQCPQWRDILFRPRRDLGTSDKYTVEYSDLVQAWQVVHEEPLEKWKKSQISADFEPFPRCSSENKQIKDDEKPCTLLCYESKQEGCSVVYQIHSGPRETFSYTSLDILEHAEYQYIIPTSGQYTAFYFVHTALDGQTRGIITFYEPQVEHPMYFYLEKTTPYQLHMAALSPDASTICLLLSNSASGRTEDYDVQVYCKRPAAYDKSFTGVAFELEYDIPGLQTDKGCPRIMFDPRYRCSRLGIINVNVVQNIRITHYFMVYNLKTKRAVTMPNESYISNNDDLDLLDAGYSPDGVWVHALIGHAMVEVGDKSIRSVWIISSDSLQIVKTVEIGSGNVNVCPVNYLPAYSKCCRTMALRHRKLVKVYQLPVPDTLLALCRSVIRKTVTDLEKLNISSELKCYLQLKAYL